MRRMIRLSVVTLAMATLSGCLGGRPVKYFTLSIPSSPQPTEHAFPVALLIGPISAPEILQDQPIVYRSGRYEIGAYQYHLWAEPPAQLVKTLLMRRLRGSGKYQSVTQLGGSTQGNFLLRGRLYNFEEVDNGGAITAKVTLEVELVDRRIHKSVWTHFYSRTEPVQGKGITDVVAALDHNLEQGLNEVESGLDSYFSSHLPRRP
ncbi:MAG TPA: ABC-type transport auxiliary lipoprotein family protein [Terriglobia bacterium]|nr:ABC-type transport auxiliary lipoprotein family protein [Terriglobia bacterium]